MVHEEQVVAHVAQNVSPPMTVIERVSRAVTPPWPLELGCPRSPVGRASRLQLNVETAKASQESAVVSACGSSRRSWSRTGHGVGPSAAHVAVVSSSGQQLTSASNGRSAARPAAEPQIR